MIPSSVHTPETLQLLRDTLDDAWAALRPHERAHEQDQAGDAPNQMAAAGERDLARLRSEALSTVVTSAL